MDTDALLRFLLWAAAINYTVMLVWFGVFLFAHDWLYRTHTRWFALSREAFDVANYAGVAIFKIGNMLLFLAPALALLLSGPA
jgi:hypothetical protein